MRKSQMLAVAGVFAIGTLVYAESIGQFFRQPDGRVGSDLSVNGKTWQTTILDGDDDHNTYAVYVLFGAQDGIEPEAIDFSPEHLIQMCNVVIDNISKFTPPDVSLEDIEHVDLNIRLGQQSAFPYDVTVIVEKGECIDRFMIDAFISDHETVSGHSVGAEFYANILSWGLRHSELKINSRSDSQKIEVEFVLLSNFDRDLSGVQLGPLCVLTLAALGSKQIALPASAPVTDYDEMEFNIVRKSRYGPVTTSHGLGSGSLDLKDGLCVGIEPSG